MNQIQEVHDQIDDQEKKWHTVRKLQEIEQQPKTWKSGIHQVNQAMNQSVVVKDKLIPSVIDGSNKNAFRLEIEVARVR